MTSAPDRNPLVHPTAEIAAGVVLGPGSRIWHQAQVAAGASVGRDCVLGKGVYIGVGARIGDRVKIQNGCGVFGALIEDEVMLAPLVVLLEDATPRATRPDGVPQGAEDWLARPVTIRRGATVGACSVVLPGVEVGPWAMVAAGSVVARDVPPHGLMAGNPVRQVGWVCRCGLRLNDVLACPRCPGRYTRSGNVISARQEREPGGYSS